MKSKAGFVVAALLVGQPSLTSAAGVSEIYQLAVESDPVVLEAKANYLSDREIEAQTRAELLPSVFLTAEGSYSETSPDLPGEGSGTGYRLDLVQPLYKPVAKANANQGQWLSRQAKVELLRAEQQLVKRVIDAYLDVLVAKTSFTTSQAEERAVKRRLDQVKAQFDVGLIAVTDVQEAQAAYDSARVRRIQAEGDLDNSYENLERLTGQPIAEVDILAESYPIQATPRVERERWVEQATRENLELQSAYLRVEAAWEAAQAGKAGHYPSVDLTASYGSDDTSFASAEEIDSGVIGVTFTLPIFEGYATTSRERESYQDWVAAKRFRDNIHRKVVQETRQLFRDLLTDVEAIHAQKQAVVSSETALEATAAGFEVGTRNVVDLLQAERLLYASIRDYQNARYRFVRDQFDYRERLGSLGPDDLTALDRWLEPEIQPIRQDSTP